MVTSWLRTGGADCRWLEQVLVGVVDPVLWQQIIPFHFDSAAATAAATATAAAAAAADKAGNAPDNVKLVDA